MGEEKPRAGVLAGWGACGAGGADDWAGTDAGVCPAAGTAGGGTIAAFPPELVALPESFTLEETLASLK